MIIRGKNFLILFSSLACMNGVLALSTFSERSNADEKESKSKGCLADNLAIEDIQRSRDELAAKIKEVSAREAELKAREAILEEELKKIDEARDQFKQAEDLAAKKNEAKVAKVVETLESMSPKSASQVFSNLDENLAVITMSRVSTQKLAKIMNLLEPTKASRLTELLAGVHRAKKPQSVEDNSQTKGGEKNDRIQQQQHNAVQAKVGDGPRSEPNRQLGSQK